MTAPALTTISEAKAFGGKQFVFSHASEETGTDMRVAVYLPPAAETAKVPALWFLSGLTCTEDNFTVKAGAQRYASELGIALIAPDTSPRGDSVPDDPDGAYDFGLGAGFYVDATEAPWSANYRMRSYIEKELPALLGQAQPLDMARQAITGHSMGGHGALTIALRNPDRFKSVSAFAPICSPMNCPWGDKALTGYIGPDKADWRQYDACAQGLADGFLEGQLKPELLEAACGSSGIGLTMRRQDGYDHSYYFIASFMEDHLRWHAERLAL